MTHEIREIYRDFLKWKMTLCRGKRFKIDGGIMSLVKGSKMDHILYTYTMKV